MKLTLNLPDSVDAKLLERGSADRYDYGLGRTAIATRDIERYYALVERDAATLRGLFVANELMLLADCCNGWAKPLGSAWSIAALATQVGDGIKLDGLDTKWSVNGASLLAKLHILTPGQTFALVDAIERWWLNPGDQPPGTLLD